MLALPLPHGQGYRLKTYLAAATLLAGTSTQVFFGPWDQQPFLHKTLLVSDSLTDLHFVADWSIRGTTVGLTVADLYRLQFGFAYTADPRANLLRDVQVYNQHAPHPNLYLRLYLSNRGLITHAAQIGAEIYTTDKQGWRTPPNVLARR